LAPEKVGHSFSCWFSRGSHSAEAFLAPRKALYFAGRDAMQKLSLLLLTLSLAVASQAKTRDWKTARVEISSETNVSWKLWGQKDTIHYTIETEDMLYFAEFSFKPGEHSDSHAPNIVINEPTKIAIEGSHAYVLDVAGKEVKLHIIRKTKK
jgi:hypothetical protein